MTEPEKKTVFEQYVELCSPQYLETEYFENVFLFMDALCRIASQLTSLYRNAYKLLDDSGRDFSVMDRALMDAELLLPELLVDIGLIRTLLPASVLGGHRDWFKTPEQLKEHFDWSYQRTISRLNTVTTMQRGHIRTMDRDFDTQVRLPKGGPRPSWMKVPAFVQEAESKTEFQKFMEGGIENDIL